jgi:hypothetical protein
MARYPLNLPTRLKQEAEQWAARQGASLNQFILWALAEKVGALNQAAFDRAVMEIAASTRLLLESLAAGRATRMSN